MQSLPISRVDSNLAIESNLITSNHISPCHPRSCFAEQIVCNRLGSKGTARLAIDLAQTALSLRRLQLAVAPPSEA